jgi:hypothetical protein
MIQQRKPYGFKNPFEVESSLDGFAVQKICPIHFNDMNLTPNIIKYCMIFGSLVNDKLILVGEADTFNQTGERLAGFLVADTMYHE